MPEKQETSNNVELVKGATYHPTAPLFNVNVLEKRPLYLRDKTTVDLEPSDDLTYVGDGREQHRSGDFLPEHHFFAPGLALLTAHSEEVAQNDYIVMGDDKAALLIASEYPKPK
jgi:hypothetical protein